MFRYLPLILKNCWRNRRRTVLTIASIGISMCLLGVMVAMFHAFFLSDPTPEQALRLVARNRISFTVSMPLSYRAQIKQVAGVRTVMVSQWFGGVYKDARDPKNQFARYGIEPDKLFTIFSEFHMPEDQKKAFERDRAGCVVGRDLAKTFGFKVGDRLNMTGDIFPGNYEFTIRGIFDSPRSSNEMYFDNEYLEQTMPERRRGNVIMYDILIDNPANSARIATAIDNQFQNSTAQTKTESEQAFVVGFLALLGNVKMFLLAISGAVLFTILLVSANTMAMSVRSRTREVAVLKTLGFTRQRVLSIFVSESVALAVAGGVIGVLVAIPVIAFLTHSFIGLGIPLNMKVRWATAGLSILVSLVLGLVSGYLPAYNASRMNIVDGLRHIG